MIGFKSTNISNLGLLFKSFTHPNDCRRVYNIHI